MEVRIALYLSAPSWDVMSAAYLWQLDHADGIQPKSGWVVHCIEAHAARRVADRMRLAAGLPPQEPGTRLTRSIVVGAEARELIRHTTAAERPARWLSSGAWALEAVRVRVEELRRQAGGGFPRPPRRIPAHLPPRRP